MLTSYGDGSCVTLQGRCLALPLIGDSAMAASFVAIGADPRNVTGIDTQ